MWDVMASTATRECRDSLSFCAGKWDVREPKLSFIVWSYLFACQSISRLILRHCQRSKSFRDREGGKVLLCRCNSVNVDGLNCCRCGILFLSFNDECQCGVAALVSIFKLHFLQNLSTSRKLTFTSVSVINRMLLRAISTDTLHSKLC